jgi:hypothetical protein
MEGEMKDVGGGDTMGDKSSGARMVMVEGGGLRVEG